MCCKPIVRLFARPRYVPAVPLGFPVPSDPFLTRFWPAPCLKPILRSTGARNIGDLGCLTSCLTRNPRTFRSGRWGSATPSGRPRDSCTPQPFSCYLDHFCGLATRRDWPCELGITGRRPRMIDPSGGIVFYGSLNSHQEERDR